MYSKFMICGFTIVHGTIAVICLLACWLIRGDFDPHYSYHPYKVVLVLNSSVWNANFGNYFLIFYKYFHFRFPWDQQTLIGYLAEIFLVIYIAGFYVVINGLFITLFISMCLQHSAFYKMFRHFVQKLDDPGKNRDNEELICKLIEFHTTTKA